MFEPKENNWNIKSLYDLQYFNCPSCPYKNNLKQEFVNHAHIFHPESNKYLRNIADDSISDVYIPPTNSTEIKELDPMKEEHIISDENVIQADNFEFIGGYYNTQSSSSSRFHRRQIP